MQTVDLYILVTLSVGGLWGLSAGMTRIFSPLALALALTAAVSVYPRVAVLFSAAGGNGLGVHAFAFLTAFLMALVVFGFINRALTAAVRSGGLKGADHLLGMLTGLTLAAFLAGWAVHIARGVANVEMQTALAASQLAPLVAQFFTTFSLWAERLLPPLEG